ncbi:MAG TPA: hypothetical protein VE442_00975 [Jatrophihabitans sp.]|nr:hypothetical protein [Jatrophihabitans sp.]
MEDNTAAPRRRRRRRRATRAQGAPPPVAVAPPAEPVVAPAPVPGPPPAPVAEPDAGKKRRRTPRDAGTERGLRDLVGAGRSQVGVSGALRARDVNRPTDEDLAEAEQELTIIRRNWKPPR